MIHSMSYAKNCPKVGVSDTSAISNAGAMTEAGGCSRQQERRQDTQPLSVTIRPNTEKDLFNFGEAAKPLNYSPKESKPMNGAYHNKGEHPWITVTKTQ